MNPQPNRFFQISLVFLVGLNFVPHIQDYAVPALVVGGICLSWRLLYEFQLAPLPNGWTKASLVLTLTYLIYLNYGTILGLEAGTAMLICGAALKLVDRVAYRDAMVLLFLNFMLLLARFFESQTLGITIFAFFDLVMTTALLVQLHAGQKLRFDVITLLKTGLRLTVQIAPFMILLFFVFPRFSTEFIRTQAGRGGMSGFSDRMEPGSVARLAENEQVAFRVRFNGEPPAMTDRYWRGAILSHNEDMIWEKAAVRGSRDLPIVSRSKGGVEQEILLEPLFDSWLFTLDQPLWLVHQSDYLQSITRFAQGNTFFLQKPQNKKMVYNVFSQQESLEVTAPEELKTFLQAPEESNESVLELVHGVKKEAKSNEHIALRLMSFYQKNFQYTLSPGDMKDISLGEFLFEKQRGFCEHFAASFAALMRIAGVPSRVVVGFQGGKKNEFSDYYLVTSRDAHAWVEIWDDDKKTWLRFDPTVMVAPMRSELGGDLYHSLSEAEREQHLAGEFEAGRGASWVVKSFLAYDAIATNWNLFLLSYDKSGQRHFFASLGLREVNQNLLLSLSLLTLLCFFLWVRLSSRQKKVAESEAQKAYLHLRKRLLPKGLEKWSYEGPSDFLKRCQKEMPEKSTEIERFRKAYLAVEYGHEDTQEIPWKSWVQEISGP